MTEVRPYGGEGSLPAVLLDPNDGALTLARTLVRRGVRVHVLAKPTFSFVAHSRGVKGRVLEDIQAGKEPWLRELDRIARDGPAVLLPSSDAASELLVCERPRIPSSLRSFESLDGAHLALMDKASSYVLAERAGLRVPWTLEVSSIAALDEAADAATYPCISKPVLGHVGKRVGDHRTRLVRDRLELVQRVRAALSDGVSMLVTEYVPGGEENLEGAVTVRTSDGSFPLAYGRSKVRQYPLDFGAGSVHRSASVPETLDLARRLLDQAGFVGVSILEVKRHPLTGERVLIEVNVRIPQGFGLGDACGVDASWRLYATLAGIPLGPQPSQRLGVQVVIPVLEARAAWARLTRGDTTVAHLLCSYRGTREVGVLDLRDPGPALALGRRGAGILGRRFLARARRAMGGRRLGSEFDEGGRSA